MRPMIYLPVALAVSLIGATPAPGQGEPRLPPPSAERCADAARTARLRAQDTYGEAVFTLGFCPDRGPDALLREWTSPPAGEGALYALGEASRTLRDRRMLEGIGRMVLAEDIPSDLRHELVNVLVGYVDRGTRVSLREGCWQYTFSAGSGLVTDGAQPLDPSQAGRGVVEIVRLLEGREKLGTTWAACSHELSAWLESKVALPDR